MLLSCLLISWSVIFLSSMRLCVSFYPTCVIFSNHIFSLIKGSGTGSRSASWWRLSDLALPPDDFQDVVKCLIHYTLSQIPVNLEHLDTQPGVLCACPQSVCPWLETPLSSAMLFSLRELVQWLGFATFELFLHLLALLVFSMLVALRADMFTPTLSWWLVFVPLFAADGLSTYFTAIVSIRLYQENEKRLAVLRLLWVLTVLSLKLVCEVLLCQKLAEQEQARDLWFGLIVSPLFILLQLLMIRACRVNWWEGDNVCDFISPAMLE